MASSRLVVDMAAVPVFFVGHQGPVIELIDGAVFLRPTRREPTRSEVLDELRTAYLAGLVRRKR